MDRVDLAPNLFLASVAGDVLFYDPFRRNA